MCIFSLHISCIIQTQSSWHVSHSAVEPVWESTLEDFFILFQGQSIRPRDLMEFFFRFHLNIKFASNVPPKITSKSNKIQNE